MKKLHTIPSIFSSPILQELTYRLRLDKAYREVVNMPLADISTPLSFNTKLLVVAVKDNAWANELQFFKHKIKARLAKKGFSFSMIRFVVDERAFLDEEIISAVSLVKPTPLLQCPVCGNGLLAGVCALCCQQQEKEQSNHIKTHLQGMPWVSYDQLDIADQQLFSKTQFKQQKQYNIRTLHDKIKEGSYELYRSPQPKLQQKLQGLVSELVSLKMGIPPDKIETVQAQTIIGKTCYKVIFGSQE